MIKEAIAKLVERQDLAESEMIGAMNQIMGGEATPAQVGSFITALRMKGETISEIVGAARVMRAHATPIRVGTVVDIDRDEINVERETIIDTCGTGGSGTRSFNISTTVALAVAACGGKVAKHGNRSITSSCGSADVLEKLGVNLDIPPEQVGSLCGENRRRFSLCTGAARGDEVRHRPAARNRHPDYFQCARAIDQSGRRRSPGARGI